MASADSSQILKHFDPSFSGPAIVQDGNLAVYKKWIVKTAVLLPYVIPNRLVATPVICMNLMHEQHE